MAFDFPDSPAVGDEYTLNGATYFWTGTTWDLQTAGTIADKVDKAGDTMTGVLTISGVTNPTMVLDNPQGANNRFEGRKDGVVRWTLDLGGAAAENTSNAGSDFVIYRFVNDGSAYTKAMQINRSDGYMTLTGGIGFGSFAQDAANLKNLNRHLALYGTTFGFNVTGSTLNYHVSTGSKHDFHVDGVTQFRVQTGTSNMYSNFNCAGLITSGVTQGNNAIQLNDGARINLSNDCLIYKNYGSNDFMFHNKSSQVFTFHISGTGDVFVIDTIGSTGNSVNVTAPESLAIGAELGVACEQYDKGDRIDVMKVIAALLLKVKALEAKLEGR